MRDSWRCVMGDMVRVRGRIVATCRGDMGGRREMRQTARGDLPLANYWYWMYNGRGHNRSTSCGVSNGSPFFVSLWKKSLNPVNCTGCALM